MQQKDLRELGSQTAKNGFKNELEIVVKFNNWQIDGDAQQWLTQMGYNLNEIEYVKAIIIRNEKTDIQVQITVKLKEAIDIQNLQVKLVSNNAGFNQIDKRWVDNYKILWEIPENIVTILKLYTGEFAPKITTSRDKRRMFMDEFEEDDRKPMNYVLNYYAEGEICITSKGNIKIGKITMQRKGGDAGRKTAKMLQFKINPAELLNER